MNDLEVSNQGPILEIVLNRPDKANALNLPLIRALTLTLRKIRENPDVRVVLLTGKENFFSAGGDLNEMAQKQGMFAGNAPDIVEQYRRGIQEIPRLLESLNIPLIAAVNGPAAGAGLDLACMCDLRLASPRARFGETFCKLGLISGDGGAFFLSRIVGYAKAMEMTLTGELYSAEDALAMGLINRIVPADELMTAARELCHQIAGRSPFAIQAAKSALKNRRNLETVLEMAAAHQALAHTTPEHQSALKKFNRPTQS